MKVYIAGPMSGIPKFNYPAFLAAADALRAVGYEVLCPAEMDSPEMQKLAMASKKGLLSDLKATGETWGDVLAKDVKLISDEIDAVVVLPGWSKSRGARLEVFVALSVQKPVFYYEDMNEIDPNELMFHIAKHVVKQGDVARYIA